MRKRNRPNRMKRPTSRSTRYRIEAFASAPLPSHAGPSLAPPARAADIAPGVSRERGGRRRGAAVCSGPAGDAAPGAGSGPGCGSGGIAPSLAIPGFLDSVVDIDSRLVESLVVDIDDLL